MKIINKSVRMILVITIIVACTNNNKSKIDIHTDFEFTGKSEWKPVLKYTKELHKKSTHIKTYPFDYDWEEIGPGYCYGPAFGHWDIVYQVLDALVYDKRHAVNGK